MTQDISYYQEQLSAKNEMMAMTTRFLMEAQAELENKNLALAQINRSLLSDISFAGLIQSALLPDAETSGEFPGTFSYRVIQQMDIGGDFIFIASHHRKTVFGLFDCTGHGVSGAMLAISSQLFLREITALYPESPAGILNRLNKRLFTVFKNGQQNIAHLEGSLFVYDHTTGQLSASSANGKAWLQSHTGIHEMTKNKSAAGQFEHALYTDVVISTGEPLRIILYSDGFTDQFGGPQNKKYSKKRLHELLVASSSRSIGSLNEHLYNGFLSWKKEEQQTDDVSYLIIEL